MLCDSYCCGLRELIHAHIIALPFSISVSLILDASLVLLGRRFAISHKS